MMLEQLWKPKQASKSGIATAHRNAIWLPAGLRVELKLQLRRLGYCHVYSHVIPNACWNCNPNASKPTTGLSSDVES